MTDGTAKHAAEYERQIERVLISEDDLQAKLRELGERITADYAGKDLLLVCVLKGAFIFLADLVRAIHLPLQIDFVVAASYGAGTVSSGEVKLSYGPRADLPRQSPLCGDDGGWAGHVQSQ